MHTSAINILEILFRILDAILKKISHFGFEGWISVLIALVPDLCILLTYMSLANWYLLQSPHNNSNNILAWFDA